jgi:hypothetical protein
MSGYPPPESSRAGCDPGPGKTNELSHDVPTTLWCQSCETNCCTIVEPLREGSLHYAKLRCGSCGRCLRFLEKPATTERRRFNGYRIAKLLSMIDLLDGWERKFITGIAAQKKLSPRQQAKLDQLAAACGIGGA